MAAGHSACIEPERNLKNLRVGESGYGKRGNVLVSTLDDLLNMDIVVSHPGCESNVRDACVKPGAACAMAETRKWNDLGKGVNGGYSFVPLLLRLMVG